MADDLPALRLRAAEAMADSVGSQAFTQSGPAWEGFRAGWLGYATAALSVVEPELAALRERAENAEEALSLIAALHPVHRCEDGHILARTPTPCLNDGVCGCGKPADRCRTRAILKTWEESRA